MQNAKKPAPKKAKRKDKKEDLIFAYSLMAAVAGHGSGDLAGRYPNVCLGMILRTPGTEPGVAAIRALRPSVEAGFTTGVTCADRGISQAAEEDFDVPLLGMDLRVVKHYNRSHIDRQGEFRGMQLNGGQFYCPLMPLPLVTAGSANMDPDATEEQQRQALVRILDRQAYATKIKDRGPNGDQRRQCPALGKSPTVTCYRRPGTKQSSTTSTWTHRASSARPRCHRFSHPRAPTPTSPPSAPSRASRPRVSSSPSTARTTRSSRPNGKEPGPACEARTRAITVSSKEAAWTASTTPTADSRPDASRRRSSSR
ncbi:hypothetical protein [Kitasatospora sp. NPDC059817]|uniref:hypothetical protein n=1 Tax=Kitasatospora sp. NPDC059817 TaxID=3346961 RepID=UPI003664D0AC